MSSQSAPADDSKRLLAALAYPIWVVALVILLTDLKKDPFMRYHGWHALYWAAAWVCIYILWNIGAGLPHLHWLFLVYPVLWPTFIVLSLFYAIQAYNAKDVAIPIVSRLARKHRT
ncbi:MAG TPA: DUF4870 domain-containing protein [bacterium]|nr:DUF4870 domain-containing protein [bacterium]